MYARFLTLKVGKMRIFSCTNNYINHNKKEFVTRKQVASLVYHCDVVSFSAITPKKPAMTSSELFYGLLFMNELTKTSDFGVIANGDKIKKMHCLSLLYKLIYDNKVSENFKRKIVTADETNSLIVNLLLKSKAFDGVYYENLDLRLVSALFEVAKDDIELQRFLLLTPVEKGKSKGIPIVYAGNKEAELLLRLSPDEETYLAQAKAYSEKSKENKAYIRKLESAKGTKKKQTINVFKDEESLNKALQLAKLPSEKLQILQITNDKGKTPLICYPKTSIALMEELYMKIPKNSNAHKLLDLKISGILTTPDNKGRIPIVYMDFENALKLLNLSPDEKTFEAQLRSFNLNPSLIEPSKISRLLSCVLVKTKDTTNSLTDFIASRWLEMLEKLKPSKEEVENIDILEALKQEKSEEERKKIIQKYIGKNPERNYYLITDFRALSNCLDEIKDPKKRQAILEKYFFESRDLLNGDMLKEALKCVQKHSTDSKYMIREFLFGDRILKIKRTKYGLLRNSEETIYVNRPFVLNLGFKDLVTALKAISDVKLKREILFSEVSTRYSTSSEFNDGDEFQKEDMSFNLYLIEQFNKSKYSNLEASLDFERLLYDVLKSPLTGNNEAIKLIQMYMPVIPEKKKNYYIEYLAQNGIKCE